MKPRFLNAVAATYSAAGSGWSGWSFVPPGVRAVEIINNRLVECSALAPLSVQDGGEQESVGYGTTPGKAGVSLGVATNVLQSLVLVPGSSSFFPSFNDIAEGIIMEPIPWAAWRAAYPLETFSDVVDVPLAMVRAYDPAVVPGVEIEYVEFFHTAAATSATRQMFSFMAAGSKWHAFTGFDIEIVRAGDGAHFYHVEPVSGALQTRFRFGMQRDILNRFDLSVWAPDGTTDEIEIRVFPLFPADPVPANLTNIGGAISFPQMHVGMSIGAWSLCAGPVALLGQGFGIGSFGIGSFGGVI